MLICTNCAQENPEDARFCNACAASLVEAPASRAQRKTVTVLFCDVSGSTALGESVDPEALRALLARYFERMKGIVQAHGGTVEKFIGDAVMAVFGVPVVHEDDALRACRAAVEMLEALPELGVQARIGVNTGEVVTGTAERLATGDAVNVAARLEQAAHPGEVLLGAATLRLVRDAVEAEPVEALTLKGKSDPVAAWRLLSVSGGTERRLSAPMVGRETELARLRAAFGQAVHDRSCQLFMMLGTAGVGKSRLAAEFLAGVDARVVRGRCLSYGEGITYWPVVEVIKQLDTLPADEAAAGALRSLLGESDAGTSAEEIAWAFRKLLEQEAQQQPLVCVLDDLHWGEETFLDLVEHVADLARDAPILLLCMARPELLDRRPGWGGGKWNATTALLEALSAKETDELIMRLLGEATTETDLRSRIREAAEGNPLFAEEMVAMLRDSPDGDVAVPPTIQALLAARLDQLDPGERGVLERGSVEGRVFHRGAVQALAPEELQVTARLTSLVRKELVRPDRPQLPGEDAYRFRHLLIRDAAYEALPKAVRAELHERFAAWLGERGADLVELDEILGYHLERAHRYRAELGPLAEEDRELGRRAAERLLAAGRRAAAAHGDMPAAANLLERASALLPVDDPTRLRSQPELASALIETGALARADEVLQQAIETAQTAGDERVEARALLERAFLSLQTDPTLGMDSARTETERLIAVFERLGDEEGLARAWRELGKVRMWLGRCEAATEALAHALVFAERAGDRRERRQALIWLLLAYIWGPLPAEEGSRRMEEIRRDPDGGREVEGMALIGLATCKAMQGRFEDARREMAAGRSIERELGLVLNWAATAMLSGRVELLAGDPARAERELREGYEALERLGETGYRSTMVALLAEAVRAQGRLEEAIRLSEASEQASAPDDLDAQSGWRNVRAQALAQQGDLIEAERLARESVALVEPTDFFVTRPESHRALADVLRLSGRPQEAAAALEEALRLYQLKGDVGSAAKTSALLVELERRPSPRSQSVRSEGSPSKRERPAPGSGAVERRAEQLHQALRASFKALFPHLEGARIEERAGYLFLLCPALPLPQLNGVWAEEQALEQEAVRELEGAIAKIEGLDLPCWVQTRSGRTPALEEEARRLGLTSEESIPGMVAAADNLRELASPGLEIARIADAAGLAEAQAVAETGFEVPPDLFAPFYTPHLATTPGLSIYLARADAKPVSTAISFAQGEAVGIFNVGTPPEHRRCGYGTAVTGRAVRDGFESGASFAWLQSSPLGGSVYRRMGFRQVETYTLLSRPENGPETH